MSDPYADAIEAPQYEGETAMNNELVGISQNVPSCPEPPTDTAPPVYQQVGCRQAPPDRGFAHDYRPHPEGWLYCSQCGERLA